MQGQRTFRAGGPFEGIDFLSIHSRLSRWSASRDSPDQTGNRGPAADFTDHALDEMDAEGETRESVASALKRASSVTLQENGRWRVHGEGLTVILQVDDAAVIVWTVFAG